MADNVFGKQPMSEPLNERVETLGYEDMTPLDTVGTASVLFTIWACGIIIMLICYCCSCATGSMCCRRCGNNLQSVTLWGSLINLVLVFYLPVMVATFISTIGLRWKDAGDSELAVAENNFWTVFMLNFWLICPILVFIMLWRSRKDVGSAQKDARPKRDESKVQWKRDWLKIEELTLAGKKPHGIFGGKKNAGNGPKLNSAKIVNGDNIEDDEEVFEGGEREVERQSLIKELGFSVNGKLIDLENQGPPPRKNAWKVFGKKLPAWVAPRKRYGKGVTRSIETQYLPTNTGVQNEDFSKEDQWSGHVDRDYGEFYKKMNLNH